MKTLKLTLILVSALVIISSCRKGSSWGIRGKGGIQTQTRDLKNFSSINLKSEGTINYTQDSVFKVSVSAQENILSILETKVIDSELRIDFLREVSMHDDIIITIHSPNLNNVTIDGSGNFVAQNALKADAVNLIINGSGNITTPTLNCNAVQTEIAGSGNISINSGTCTSASYKISGSGNIFASGFVCKSASVRVSGSGNISLHATDNLDINSSGSGDIRYRGNPAITNKMSGSGSLIKIN